MMKLNDSPAPRREQQSKSSPTMPSTASSYTGMPAPRDYRQSPQATYDVPSVSVQPSQFAAQPTMGFSQTGYISSPPPPPPYTSSQPPPPPPPPPPTGPPNFYSSKF